MYGHVNRYGNLFSKEDATAILNSALAKINKEAKMNCDHYSHHDGEWIDCPGEESVSAQIIVAAVECAISDFMKAEIETLFTEG